MHERRGIIYTLLCATMWGTTPAVSRLLLDDFSVIQIVFFNSIVSTLLFIGICIQQKKISEFRKFSPSDYLTFAIMGLLGIYLYRMLLIGAINVMPAQEAFIINYMWPIMVVVLAWVILKEKMNLVKISGIIISFIGVVIVTTKGNFSQLDFNLQGTTFALLAAFSYGLYSVLSKRQHYDRLIAITAFSTVTLIYATATFLIFSSWPTFTTPQIVGMVYLGAFPNGLALFFWLLALKYGDTVKVSNLIFVTPFISLIFIRILVGETILLSSVVGLAIILAGVFLEKIKTKVAFSTER